MPLIELEEAKRHLAISHGHDDDLLLTFIRTAEGFAAQHLRRDLKVDFPDEIPEPIKTCLSMHVFALYTSRGGDAPPPPAYEIMMAPYRNLAG
ncbi:MULTISPECIES: head-tail connector protein [unclassified Pseudovibrio]|uniref:head-tail connector protein n=1 Tax=unclassified Pseudovibrio TaxID=2627060 RepID=UPI0007AE643E|nr:MULTISPECIES: head-tail connector protein [unclassified Pseudovibrio]KZL00494.1 Phage gp6-like head-tail connector protein [Pseudovibrio sp. W74]KZL07494.1 Phage gp6-like head-tail connector protein [Pseudovibrio sp. Ad14]